MLPIATNQPETPNVPFSGFKSACDHPLPLNFRTQPCPMSSFSSGSFQGVLKCWDFPQDPVIFNRSWKGNLSGDSLGKRNSDKEVLRSQAG